MADLHSLHLAAAEWQAMIEPESPIESPGGISVRIGANPLYAFMCAAFCYPILILQRTMSDAR